LIYTEDIATWNCEKGHRPNACPENCTERERERERERFIKYIEQHYGMLYQ